MSAYDDATDHFTDEDWDEFEKEFMGEAFHAAMERVIRERREARDALAESQRNGEETP